MDFLQRLNKRELLIAGVLSWCLIAVALAIYVVKPEITAYLQHRSEYELLSSAAELAGDPRAEINRLEQANDVLEHELYGALVDVPKEQVEAFIMGELQRISWQHQTTLIGVTPREGAQIDAFESVQYDVELVSAYFDLANWFQQIQTDLGSITVSQFSVIRSGNEQPTQLRVSASLVSYRARS